MDDELRQVKNYASWSGNWTEVAVSVSRLCSYIATLEARIAALEYMAQFGGDLDEATEATKEVK